MLTEFLASQNGHKFEDKLDPDTIEFTSPDFGFNNPLQFENELDPTDPDMNGWRKLMDCIATYPKYQRLHNYIQFVNNKKLAGMFAKQVTSSWVRAGT